MDESRLWSDRGESQPQGKKSTLECMKRYYGHCFSNCSICGSILDGLVNEENLSTT